MIDLIVMSKMNWVVNLRIHTGRYNHLVDDGQMTSQPEWHRTLRDFSVNPIDDNNDWF
jgi:hypothetical protein